MSFAAVEAARIRRGADWAQTYYWGSDDLTGWAGSAVFTLVDGTQHTVTPVLGAAGSVALSIPGATSALWAETYPLGRWRPVGTWALSLTSPAGAKYAPFGGPVHLLS
jgi:hypothetical protein